MRVLVTGGSGFVGRHLAAELTRHGHECVLTAHHAETIRIGSENYDCLACDITQRDAVVAMVAKVFPDAVIHLAAISHVVAAEQNLEQLSAINIVGTHNICAGLRSLERPSSLLNVSSSQVYGGNEVLDGPVDEKQLPIAFNAYGNSKLAAEGVVRTFEGGQLRCYTVRPFNHIGPGQSAQFVCAAIANRIFKAAADADIEMGNLEVRRDFTDVRDIVRAYRLILEKTPAERLFVLGQGKTTSIAEVFQQFKRISGKNVSPAVKEELRRNQEGRTIYADISRARQVLGWQPEISLASSLDAIYESLGR